jgi:hypothetical protein
VRRMAIPYLPPPLSDTSRMFKELIHFFQHIEHAEITKIDLEEIALLQALHQSFPAGSPELTELEYVPALVTQWLSVDYTQLARTLNMRLQPLLSAMLTVMMHGQKEALNPSEVLYILAMGDILERIQGKDEKNRLIQLFRSHRDLLLLQEKSQSPAPGLPHLQEVLQFTTARELQAAPRRRMDSFG